MVLQQNGNGLRELHLFAGAGGGILGGILGGNNCVCAVELEDYPRRVLLQRQRDGILPWFPIWDDVRTFDGMRWRGKVDLLCGGFPCQNISAAGKGAGITGARSGLWKEFARIVGEIRPPQVLIENSPLLRTRGLETVLEDLASLGFDAEWGIVGAHHVGAPHRRDRLWVLASDPAQVGWRNDHGEHEGGEHTKNEVWLLRQFNDLLVSEKSRYVVQSASQRVRDGLASGMDRLGATGNGQVPAVAALAYRMLNGQYSAM